MFRNVKGYNRNKSLGNPALEVYSKKFVDSYCECPTMTALVLSFGAKAFNDTELCNYNARLAGGNTIVISTEEKTKTSRLNF